jgi:biopolymer transport protein ExbD
MGSKFGGDELIADINITPFVDIVLVVLIIFMVTATEISKASIKVKLPEAATAEATGETSLGLTLTADGQMLLDGEPTDVPAIQAAVQQARATSGDKTVALISADKGVAYGRVAWLVDLVKSEGVANFALNLDKASMVPPDPALSSPARP